jgi:ribosomal protein S8
MKKIILFAFIAVALLAISASAQAEVRVKFAKGKMEKTVSGVVQGRGYIDYIFKIAEADQDGFLEVSLKSTNKSVKFTLTNPSDKIMKGGKNVREFSNYLGASGDFKVRVYVDGTNQRTGKYTLTIATFQGT